VLGQRLLQLAEIGAGRDLECDAQKLAGISVLERNRLFAELGGENGSLFVAFDDTQPDDLRPVVDRPFACRAS